MLLEKRNYVCSILKAIDVYPYSLFCYIIIFSSFWKEKGFSFYFFNQFNFLTASTLFNRYLNERSETMVFKKIVSRSNNILKFGLCHRISFFFNLVLERMRKFGFYPWSDNSNMPKLTKRAISYVQTNRHTLIIFFYIFHWKIWRC